MYRSDHIKVLKVLAGSLPKRPTFKTKDVVDEVFKRAENGDRRVRNAYRKIRKEGHAEIADRGEYRLTASGAALCAKLAKDGWKVPKEEAPKKVTKKAAPKKAAKKKVAKKTTTKKAAAKKASPKKAPAKKKAAAKKTTTKRPPKKAATPKKSGETSKAASKGNGVSKGNNATAEPDASAGATLSF